MTYAAPLQDMEFVMTELADLDGVGRLPPFGDATPDLVRAVLEEADKMVTGVLAPLNETGDREGSRLDGSQVRTPEGWRDAYRHFVEGGWNALPFDPTYGGQGLPWLLATAVQEMLNSANMSFALCPMLTQGAVEAISRHGSSEQRERYLPKLVSGEWTGTMNLTEPQAGSDLSAVKARAVPEGDHYRISGQKIYITYGDHDLTENIVHLVLARTPGAPSGVKGISLFIVPKMLLDDDGNPGRPNDLRCVSLEHKLGIHASPTAVMSYGDEGGAVGYLVGEENRGLEYMFTMMNVARHSVGLEGVAIAERAYQRARAFSRERVQGREVGGGPDRVPIVRHPDVRRMLLTMKAQTEAMRALAYVTATAMDKAAHHPEPVERRDNQALVDILIPIVKGWSTELGVEIASLGVQVHGGMGFIEETGAAQHLRDARIAPIYEGTTGIQASDLVGRKVLRDGGDTARAVIDAMRRLDNELGAWSNHALEQIRSSLREGTEALTAATDWLLEASKQDPRLPLAASVSYLMLWGTVAGGWQLARGAVAAQRRLEAGEGDADFHNAKLATARYYAVHLMPQASALSRAVTEGSEAVLELDDALL